MSGTVERFVIALSMLTLAASKPNCQKQDQIPGEVFASHDRIEVYVYKVEDNPRGVKCLL